MRKMLDTLNLPRFAAALLAASLLVTAIPATAEDDAEARRERIKANLRLKYPQLEQANITVNEITPTEFSGLDAGSFAIPGRGAQQFLVSNDDKKLWLVGGDPIDVSRSKPEIDAEIAERKAAEDRKAAELKQQLDAAIAGLPARGNPDAPVTIVEFSDFQCPYCARGASTMDQLIEKYPNDVKLVFKHFPLGFHPWAKPAAIASHCAGKQSDDAFWTLHDKFFQNQKGINPQNVVSKSKEFLAGSGIDMAAWETCAGDTDSSQYAEASAAVDADMQLGQTLGVTGTPGFFVNGTFLNGAQPVDAFAPLIEAAKRGS